ncbi:MAG: OmpA family protein [Saprospiraceae bacterium]|nr:OmpA family protein [Saprospiraceae bacterium]
MSINLLDFTKSQINNTHASKIAALLNEKNTATQKALDVLYPSVLGSIANSATTLSGADELLGIINEGSYDGRIFDNMGALLDSDSALQSLLINGNKLSSTFLGDKIMPVVNWVATHAGIKTGSVLSLLDLAAPLVMNSIGKNMDGRRTASSLVGLLGSQLPILKKAIPSELSSLLGLTKLAIETPQSATSKEVSKPTTKPATQLFNTGNKTTSKETTKETQKSTTQSTSPSNEKPLIQRLKPWLILLGASLFGLICLRTCKKDPADTPTTATTATTTTTADKPNAEPTATVSGDQKVLKLSEGDLTVKTGSFLDKLYTTITDANADLSKSIVFENVSFEKYKTDLTDSSKIQLDDVVKVLKAYPSVNIKINGYTDSRGNADENKELSRGRAASVKSYLSSKGIASERMSSEGLGAANPIADNAEEAGRAKNRRIEATITKK